MKASRIFLVMIGGVRRQWKALVGEWNALPLRVKVVATSLFVTLVVASSTIFIAMRGYEREREAYVFELHAAHTSVAASGILDVIGAMRGQGEAWASLMPGDTPRAPDNRELFASGEGSGFVVGARSVARENITLFSRSAEGRLVTTALKGESIGRAFASVAGTKIYLITQSGSLLFANGSRGSGGDGDKELFQAVFRSNMSEGNTVIERNGKPAAIGFREIRDTNLVLVAETSLANVMTPLRRAILIWILAAAPVLALGLLIQSLLLGSLGRPMAQMIDMFRRISRGNFRTILEIPEGELRPVFEGALAMQTTIADREQRLTLLARGLHEALVFAQEPGMARQPKELGEAMVEALAKLSRPAGSALLLESSGLVAWSKPLGDSSEQGWLPAPDRLEELLALRDTHAQAAFVPSGGGAGAPRLVLPFEASPGARGLLVFPLENEHQRYELTQLGPIFASTVKSMFLHCASADAAAHQAMLDRELAVARSVQERSLVLPEGRIPGLDISTVFEPANLVGGDWMGIFPHPHGKRFHFYLGDVTGHGVDAAFHTSLVAGAVQVAEADLDERLKRDDEVFDAEAFLSNMWYRLNELFQRTAVGKSMTMFMGSLDTETGELAFILAGHPQPLWLGTTSGPPPKKSLHASPASQLGSALAAVVPVGKTQLRTGDCLVVFTDGLMENMPGGPGKHGRGFRTVAQKIAEEWAQPEDGVARAVFDWSLKTSGDAYLRDDDVAVAFLRWTGFSG